MFVVVVKPSARKANAAAGRAVAANGTRRVFEDGASADEWATALSKRGGRPVWLRRAHPSDDDDVDAYLLSQHRDAVADDSTPDGRAEIEPLPDDEDARGPLADFYAPAAE